MLRVERVAKTFENGLAALQPVSFHVGQGEIVGLLGTSGSGKSTLLRIIGGLHHASAGQVLVGRLPVRAPRLEIGLVFQEPRLMPWLTVEENVRFGLYRLSKDEQAALAREALNKVGLLHFAAVYPRQLSGGMAQRVAIARALVTRPSLLLLDEPFSALDAFTRLQLQEHLLKTWEYDRPTMLFVTHDIEEALALSDRVVVLRGHPGRVDSDFALDDLTRPRKRTDAGFQAWKARILDRLDLSLDI
ncbi:MAG TPA: ABC transporter ATP-binding protein [Candidatus Cybelea sp.]|nr:ABC transporter ATP-binding protein [Candidatus Cybelea sp.]